MAVSRTDPWMPMCMAFILGVCVNYAPVFHSLCITELCFSVTLQSSY